MRKYILFLLGFCLYSATSHAAKPSVPYLEEMYVLGAVSGQGLACKSKQYHRFELLARAMIVTKATSDEEQREGMERYANGKINSFADVERQQFRNCDAIRQAFESQKIFKNVLYSDGRIQMFDGTMIAPRQPYDAANLYQKDPEAFIKADEAYKKYLAIAKENAKNAPTIELRDSSADRLAHLFN